MIDSTTQRAVAIKKKPTSTMRIAQRNGIEEKDTRQGQGTGSAMFVALDSNKKRMLSQNAWAKPGTNNAMKNIGI